MLDPEFSPSVLLINYVEYKETESFFACRWRSCQNCPNEAVSAMRICSTLDFELSPEIQTCGTSVTS